MVDFLPSLSGEGRLDMHFYFVSSNGVRAMRIGPLNSNYNSSMPQSSKTPISQKFRREATKEENQLWYQFLRSRPLNFRRQKVIGKYIVDFYCAKAKLVIELDGSQHFEEQNQANELKREGFLRDKGYQVIRFLNSDIWSNFSDVCRAIDEIVNPDNSNQFS